MCAYMAPSLDTRQDMAEVVVSELALRPCIDLSVKRIMLYQQGCYAGGTVLRIAKDLAENTKGAPVLILCSETTILAAIIVGSNPMLGVEKPIVELVSTTETLVPNSAGAICETIREHALIMHIGKEAPDLIGNHTENRLIEVFHPLGISDWNSVFWAAHPGGRAILDQVEA
ncbi:hypothetical protein Patl1_20611 [Pistacia atlantica]|uniref:Uncharacterized protein n=1 Tax=Pistacia atlantica TaxID=434234 RepID=A0ACC1BLJ2_9ROSI|nr:hypothetical protein Patl1_20611 [Pistacia atlantica]